MIRHVLRAVVLALSLTSVSVRAGCLEPEKTIGDGKFIVEGCNFRTTTNFLNDDPRTQSAPKYSSGLMAVNKKTGEGKIRALPSKMVGVVLTGKFEGKDEVIDAFLRTDKATYCNRLEKSRMLEVKVVQQCCDCSSCVETPCSVGIKNLVVKEGK